MSQRYTLPSIVIALLLFVAFAKAQDSCMMIEAPLSAQVANNDLIVTAAVTSKESHWNADRTYIYTQYELNVSNTFKGQSGSTVQFIAGGGLVGDQLLVEHPGIDLSVGQVATFFLVRDSTDMGAYTKTDTFRPYYGAQGYYKHYGNGVVANGFQQYDTVTEFASELVGMTSQGRIPVTPQRTPAAKIIVNLSPAAINAGANEVLTITGNNFGATQGTSRVLFANADDGGATQIPALDGEYLQWTDTSIQVVVPYRAGTGAISIDTNNDDNPELTSTTPLTVDSNTIQLTTNNFGLTTPEESIDIYMVDTNGNGGMTWQLYTDFANGTDAPGAADSFIRGFDEWRCNTTQVNWVEGPVTTFDTSSSGNTINSVRFDNGSGTGQLAAGTLGLNATLYSGCAVNGQLEVTVAENDIQFNDDFLALPNSANAVFNFGPGNVASDFSEIDFESVVTHELGHAHQLGHRIAPNELMHFAFAPSDQARTPSMESAAAAEVVHQRSMVGSSCPGAGATTEFDCSTLNLDDQQLVDVIAYPNPTTGMITVSGVTAAQSARIMDVNGRILLNHEVAPTQLNLGALATGVYFLELSTASNSRVIRLVKQ